MLRNVGSNGLSRWSTIAATYVLTPFVIHRLGQEGYGIWTLITSLTGYISLLALGVPMACVRYLAQHVAERDDQEGQRGDRQLRGSLSDDGRPSPSWSAPC